jgi:hypothetical protein
MSKIDREPQCVVGNGVCPSECPLNEKSSKITKALGDNVNPFQLKLKVVFGDASNPHINVTDIARVIGSCIKEGQ